MVVHLEEQLQQEGSRPKSSNISRNNQLESQVQEMTLYISEQEQKISMKDYEINGLKDKIQYLEE